MLNHEKENRRVIIKKYLIDHPDTSLRELGELLGISRQRVHVLLRGMGLKTDRLKISQRLTDHQLDILDYLAKGYNVPQIAEIKGCKAQSIRNRLWVIYAKLGVHNRKDAVQIAKRKGLLRRSAFIRKDN